MAVASDTDVLALFWVSRPRIHTIGWILMMLLCLKLAEKGTSRPSA